MVGRRKERTILAEQCDWVERDSAVADLIPADSGHQVHGLMTVALCHKRMLLTAVGLVDIL